MLRRGEGMGDVLVIGGGIMRDDDIPALKEAGGAAIFGPGTPSGEIADFMRQSAQPRA